MVGGGQKAMRFSYEDLVEMRKNGATYTQIGKALGVSRQRAFQMLMHYDKSLKGIRGHGFCIDSIIYKGIYEHFEKDIYETITSFAEKVHRNRSAYIYPKIRDFITGEHNSMFTISQLQRMCEIVGKPFEETFAIREKKGCAEEHEE